MSAPDPLDTRAGDDEIEAEAEARSRAETRAVEAAATIADAPTHVEPPVPGRAEVEDQFRTLATTETSEPIGPFEAFGDRPVPRVISGYELIEKVGIGGMGEVWRARQLKLNRIVALKMVKGSAVVGPKEMIRFLAEAESIAAIRHPNVVQVFDYGESGGRPFLVMEYLPGGSLNDRLRQVGRMAPDQAAELVQQLATGVQAAHDQQIVHRDLKPGNVLFDANGEPKLTDFGLAKRTGVSDLTTTQVVMGTPAYMPPEQARGETKFVGPAADVYSLGVILYECLTGTRPFDDVSQIGLLRKVAEDLPDRPRKRVPDLPRDLELVTLKCLEKRPVDRYPTAGRVAEELRRYLAGEPLSVRTSGIVERAARWARRKPTQAALYALGLLAAILGGLGGLAAWQWRQAVVVGVEAERQRVEAERQSEEAQRQRERFERSEYGGTIRVAHQEWRDDNVPATLSLLEGTRADLRGWEWRYVWRLCHAERLAIRGHEKAVLSASYSPDGHRILSAGADGTVRLWDAETGVEVMPPRRPRAGAVLSASYSPDGRWIAVAYEGARTCLLDGRTAELRLQRDGCIGKVTPSTFFPRNHRIVTASAYGTIRILGLGPDDGEGLAIENGPDGTVYAAAFHPDGNRVLVAGDDGMAGVWEIQKPDDAEEPEPISLKGHIGMVLGAGYNPDGTRIVTAGADGTVRIWDAKTGASLRVLKGHSGAVNGATFGPGGRRILSAGADRTARLWDAETGERLQVIKGHTGAVTTASFHPDGRSIVTASDDGSVRVWDAQAGPESRELAGGHGPLRTGAYSPDGRLVVLGGDDGVARIQDARTGEVVHTLGGTLRVVHSAAFDPTGRRVVVAGDEETVRLWAVDVHPATVERELRGHTGTVHAANFSPDGQQLVTACFDATARVWDARGGRCLAVLRGHTQTVNAATFDREGSRVVTASDDATARIWNPRESRCLAVLEGHSGKLYAAAFDPRGDRVVTAGEDETVRIWDANRGTELFRLKGVLDGVRGLAFSPNGDRLVTVGDDATLRVWDSRWGALVLALRRGDRPIHTVAFAPDGDQILTAGDDGAPVIWEAALVRP